MGLLSFSIEVETSKDSEDLKLNKECFESKGYVSGDKDLAQRKDCASKSFGKPIFIGTRTFYKISFSNQSRQ